MWHVVLAIVRLTRTTPFPLLLWKKIWVRQSLFKRSIVPLLLRVCEVWVLILINLAAIEILSYYQPNHLLIDSETPGTIWFRILVQGQELWDGEWMQESLAHNCLLSTTWHWIPVSLTALMAPLMASLNIILFLIFKWVFSMYFYQDFMVSNLKAASELRVALMYSLDQCPTSLKVLHVLTGTWFLMGLGLTFKETHVNAF